MKINQFISSPDYKLVSQEKDPGTNNYSPVLETAEHIQYNLKIIKESLPSNNSEGSRTA